MVATGPCDRTCGWCGSDDTVTAPARIVGGSGGLTAFCNNCRAIYHHDKEQWIEGDEDLLNTSKNTGDSTE